MIYSNISNNIINEDFFDEIETDDIIDSDVEELSSQKDFNHTINIKIAGVDLINSAEILQSLLINYIKKVKFVLNVIKSIKDYSEPEFYIIKEQDRILFELKDIPSMYKNDSRKLFKLYSVAICINILSDFKNIRQIDKSLHSILISIESNHTNAKLYTIGMSIDKTGLNVHNHYINKYTYQKKEGDYFIIQMSSVVSAMIPSEYKPIEQMFKFYHIGYYDRIVEMIRGRFGKSVRVCDLDNPPYPVGDIISNTTRLYKPGFIDSREGTMEFHRDTNETYYDFMAPEKDGNKIYEICNDAVSQMIKENSKYQIYLVHGNGGPGGIVFIFENTYAYKDVEYIVTVSYEFEAPIASYSISQSDMDKIREELVDEMGFSEGQVMKWFMDVHMLDEHFFKK